MEAVTAPVRAQERIRTHRRSCPICESGNRDAAPGRYSRDGWTVIDCLTCGFVYLPDVPITTELVENLAWEKQFEAETNRRKQKQPIVQWLDQKTRWRLHTFKRIEGVDILNERAPSGPALDLGCGSGGQLLKFDERFTPHGVEISKGLAAAAAAAVAGRNGSVVQASSADGLNAFPDRFFTAALLRSYLEHDWQARDIMTTLYKKMAPGGLVAIKVPNYGSVNRMVVGSNWCGFRLPDHVNYFTKRHLGLLAQQTGFTMQASWRHTLPTDDNMLVFFEKQAAA